MLGAYTLEHLNRFFLDSHQLWAQILDYFGRFEFTMLVHGCVNQQTLALLINIILLTSIWCDVNQHQIALATDVRLFENSSLYWCTIKWWEPCLFWQALLHQLRTPMVVTCHKYQNLCEVCNAVQLLLLHKLVITRNVRKSKNALKWSNALAYFTMA